MLGVLINVATVIVGSIIGLLIKKGINDKISSAIMTIIGLCVVALGIQGALEISNALIMIVALVVGTLLGMILHISHGIDKLGNWVEVRFNKGEQKVSIAQGFVTASLVFCVGGMTIVGSLTAGISGNNDILIAKAILDLISSCILASTLGVGVLLSALFVLVVQGGLVLLSGVIGGLLTNQPLIGDITAVGGVMMIALGLNLAKITKIDVADMLPAFIVVVTVYYLIALLGL